MAFIYTDREQDRKGTKRCKGCGNPKPSNIVFNNSTGLCPACLSLENVKNKKKKK